MTRALAVVTVAAALLAAGCGGSHAQRKAITDYIDHVNAVERALATPFAAVSKANVKFAKAKTHDPQLAGQLLASERTMRSLSRQLAAIDAPPEVAHLRALLLELVNRQLALTREVSGLFTFVPAFQAALAPLRGADAQLTAVLHRSSVASVVPKAVDAEKAAALETYAATVDGVIAKLHELRPPSVWRPGYSTQLASLAALRATARSLAAAIRANRAAALPALLSRFDRAAVSNRSTAAQKAERAAVIAYDARIRSLVTLSHEISVEQGRLQRLYG